MSLAAQRLLLCVALLVLVAPACAPLPLERRAELTVSGHGGGGDFDTKGGVDLRVDYRHPSGVRSGLVASYMRWSGQARAGFFATPSGDFDVNFAGVTPSVGYEVRGFHVQGGLTFYLGHNSELFAAPIPWITMRMGRLDSAWFELANGPSRGLWTVGFARLGGGGRFGGAVLRGGAVFLGVNPVVDGGGDFQFELEAFFGVYADFRWVDESGWGFALGGTWMHDLQWEVTAGVAIDLHTVFGDD